MQHAEARAHIVSGFRWGFDREPSLTEAQVGQAVGLLESRYGAGWKSAGVGSKNWGAVQAGRPPCNPISSFLYQDTHPNPDGSSTLYQVCFKRYATDDAGASDMLKFVFGTSTKPKDNVLRAADRGDLYGVSAAMRKNGYYEGFGKTQAERIENHHRALRRSVATIAKALGEPMPDGKPTLGTSIGRIVGKIVPATRPPTLRRGSIEAIVKDWQRVVGVVADGIFGPVTEAETILWQGAHKDVFGKPLKPDGVVGPLTWGAAMAERLAETA